jgi:hypothetical protein
MNEHLEDEMSQHRRLSSKDWSQMKTVACFLAISSVLIPFTCGAQTPVAAHVASVPSAKILAIGRFNARPTPEQLQILSFRWYATGKIDQWFSPQDGNGVVLILNLSSVDEAHAMLDFRPSRTATIADLRTDPGRSARPLDAALASAGEACEMMLCPRRSHSLGAVQVSKKGELCPLRLSQSNVCRSSQINRLNQSLLQSGVELDTPI